MTTAIENTERGTLFVDYIGLFAPAGVVTGALIAAAIAWWNERKSPLDHLKTLIEIRKNWPPDLRGVEAIDYEVGRQVAKLRLAVGADDDLNAAGGMAAVEQARRRRRTTTNRLMFWLMLAAVVVGITVYWARRYPYAAAGGGWIWAMLLAATLVGWLFEMIRLAMDAGWRRDMRTNLSAARQALRDEVEIRNRMRERQAAETGADDVEDPPRRLG